MCTYRSEMIQFVFFTSFKPLLSLPMRQPLPDPVGAGWP